MAKRSLNRSLAVALGISGTFGGVSNSSVTYAMESSCRIKEIERARNAACELKKIVCDNLDEKKIYDFSYYCTLVKEIKSLVEDNKGIFSIRKDIMTPDLENKLKRLLKKIAEINLEKINFGIQSDKSVYVCNKSINTAIDYAHGLWLIAYYLPTPDGDLKNLLEVLRKQSDHFDAIKNKYENISA